jgi:hypothetical protein
MFNLPSLLKLPFFFTNAIVLWLTYTGTFDKEIVGYIYYSIIAFLGLAVVSMSYRKCHGEINKKLFVVENAKTCYPVLQATIAFLNVYLMFSVFGPLMPAITAAILTLHREATMIHNQRVLSEIDLS